MLVRTHTRTHVTISFADPFLVCDGCRKPVAEYHDHERCGCDDTELDRHDCGALGVTSACPSWGPVDGCTCLQSLGYVPHAPAATTRVHS